MKYFYPTCFCKLSYSNIDLGHLQIGNPKFNYPVERFDLIERPPIEINIDTNIDKQKFKEIFAGTETGYIGYLGETYYRNCNVVSNFAKRNVLYSGKLPGSCLDISWELKGRNIVVDISVTKRYIIEAASRLTSNPPFEMLLSGLIYHFSVYLGFVPFHAAAVYDEVNNSTQLFMGLPNTGKTTTAADFAKLNKNLMISEDIVFVHAETMDVYSAPFTFNPKNSDRFYATQDYGHNLNTIIMLNSDILTSSFEFLCYDLLKSKIYDMNFYEFSWLDNLILRHLFCSDEEIGLGKISSLYLLNMDQIAKKVRGISIKGNDRENWAALLSSEFRKQNKNVQL